jgi:hypothetical protein
VLLRPLGGCSGRSLAHSLTHSRTVEKWPVGCG